MSSIGWSRGAAAGKSSCGLFSALYKRGNGQGHDLQKANVIYRSKVLPVYDDDPLLRTIHVMSWPNV
jgi:hypothetical protein